MRNAGWCTIIGMLSAGLATTANAEPASTPLTGPSFSCATASAPLERTICAEPALAAADREMAMLFARVRTSAFGSGPSNELAAQRRALKAMRGCVETGRTVQATDCLAGAYARRNRELAVAALMVAPEIALPVLRRIDPGAAPLLEATALWAVQPVDADWSMPQRKPVKARIAALLTPYLTALLTNEDQSFGRSILTDPSPNGIAVKSIADVFKSDAHFAAFLNVLGPYLPEAGAGALGLEARRTLPCAAIVRHPALLQATTSLYGSTMDNFVLDNDCSQTLPPTPALDALDGTIMRTWPPCDGTIRFAAYRGYATAIDEARLGRRLGGTMPIPAEAVTKRAGVTPARVAAARAELAAYYATYLGKPAATASGMARNAIAEVLSSAHECGG